MMLPAPFQRQITHTLVFTICLVISATGPKSFSAELIVNGDFSDGVTGWYDVSSDFNVAEWFLIEEGSRSPVTGNFPISTEGGVEGIFAVSDSAPDSSGDFIPNELALLQEFSVPSDATSVMLSLDVFVNDWSGQSDFNASQSARIDIIPAGFDEFDTSESAIVYNAYAGTDGGPVPVPFVQREFELLPFVEVGQDYLFRVMATSQESWLHVGIDNVSINAVVPEPNIHPAGLLIFWSTAMVLFSREDRGCSLLSRQKPMVP